MNVLTATIATQGSEPIDKFEAIENELVIVEHCSQCDPEKTFFKGITSHGLTSTAQITNVTSLDFDTYVDILMTTYKEELYFANWTAAQRDDYIDKLHEEVIRLTVMAEQGTDGTVIRRDSNNFFARAWDKAA